MLISYEIKKNINNIDLLIIKIIIESNIAIDLLDEIIKIYNKSTYCLIFNANYYLY